MLDGINCLVGIFITFSLIIFKLLILGTSLGFLDIVLIVTLLILSFFNYKNYLFLGNSGTTFLSGYMIYTLISNNYVYEVNVWQVISLFLIPGVDMVRLFFARISLSRSPFDRDTLHFHHILSNKFNLLNSLIFYFTISFMPVFFEYFYEVNIFLIQVFSLTVYFWIIIKSNTK